MRTIVLFICHLNGKTFISDKEHQYSYKIRVLLPAEFESYKSTEDETMPEFPGGAAGLVKDVCYMDFEELIAEDPENGKEYLFEYRCVY